MVGEGRGDGVHHGNTRQDKELRPVSGACGTTSIVPQEAGEGGQASKEAEAPIRISYRGVITLRRVRIEPSKKRGEYVQRLEQLISICEEALSDPQALEEIQLKAASVIIRAIRTSYAIVREEDVENLEQLAQEIKRQLAEDTE